MKKILLHSMIKNEENKISSMILSTIDYIDFYHFIDTGSTDNTISIIEKIMDKYKKEFIIYNYGKFVNFVDTRNEGLRSIYENKQLDKYEYIMLMDADETIIEEQSNIDKINLIKNSEFSSILCDIYENNVIYPTTRFIANNKDFYYKGPNTHEYIDSNNNFLPIHNHDLKIKHSPDIKKSNIKYERDIKMLNDYVSEDQGMMLRKYFYLGNSYKDMGIRYFDNAISTYKKYINLSNEIHNTFKDEWYQVLLELSRCYITYLCEEEALYYLILAQVLDEDRREAWILAGDIFNLKGDDISAIKYYEKAINIEQRKDILLWWDPDFVYNQVFINYISILYKNKDVNLGYEVMSKWDCAIAPQTDLYNYNMNNLNWYKHLYSEYQDILNNDKKILCMFIAHNHYPEFIDSNNKLESEILYGTERSYIKLAENINYNYNVIVITDFKNKDVRYVIQNNVIYFNIIFLNEFDSIFKVDYLLISRCVEDTLLKNDIVRNWKSKNYVWMHDLGTGDPNWESIELQSKIDGVIVSTKYHYDYNFKLLHNKDIIRKFKIIPLGLDINFIANQVHLRQSNNDKFRFIYYSSPDRALSRIIDIWEDLTHKIKKEQNVDIEMDAYIENRYCALNKNIYFRILDRINKFDNINVKPPLPNRQLISKLNEYDGMLYLNNTYFDDIIPLPFQETFCLSVCESQLAGLLTIASNYSAVGENVIQTPISTRVDIFEENEILVDIISKKVYNYINDCYNSNHLCDKACSKFYNHSEISNKFFKYFEKINEV